MDAHPKATANGMDRRGFARNCFTALGLSGWLTSAREWMTVFPSPAHGERHLISSSLPGPRGNHTTLPAGCPHDRNVIWFRHPPSDGWLEGLPIGNGRLGAMVLGYPLRERIGLNHDRLWRKYYSYHNFDTASVIAECRRLCLEKKWDEAQALLLSKIPDHGTARDVFINPFVPVGDLGIYPVSEGSGETSDFERRLNLDTGVAEVVYMLDGVQYRRNAFVSWPARVLVVYLTAGKTGRLSGEVTLSRLLDPDCIVTGASRLDELVMEGTFDEGVHFACVLRVLARGGKLLSGRQTYQPAAGVLPLREPLRFTSIIRPSDATVDPAGISTRYESADEVLLLLAIATDDESPSDPVNWCRQRLASVRADYGKLHVEHIADHRRLYRRVRLQLGGTQNDTPTDVLMESARIDGNVSPLLVEQLFNMGRYLAIASGRPSPLGEPAKCPINLQGIWNQDRRPVWDSDLHTDLNIEMAYWPLSMVNLPELMGPLAAWLMEMTPKLRTAARDRYGCGGVFVNMVMGLREVGGADANCIEWTAGAAWLSQILWHHWEYTRDEQFLRGMLYSFLKEVAAFYGDNLVEDDRGRLLPIPSMSPENPIKGRKGYNPLGTAATMDLELIHEVFTHVLASSQRLNVDEDKRAKWLRVLSRVPKPTLSPEGRLQEWLDDYQSREPGHRHRSHFVAFAPGDRITAEDTPEENEGVRRALMQRQSEGTATAMSFSYVWDAQIHSRLYEAEKSLHQICLALQRHVMDNLLFSLFDFHHGDYNFQGHKKLFQIDAGIAVVAAISEMFVQDRRGLLRILPALPTAFPEGRISGLRSRGLFEVEVAWKDGQLTEGRIKSLRAETCRVKSFRPAGELLVVNRGKKVPTKFRDGVTEFDTRVDEYYVLAPAQSTTLSQDSERCQIASAESLLSRAFLGIGSQQSEAIGSGMISLRQ
jgi:alpha-L-fucosidase 2